MRFKYVNLADEVIIKCSLKFLTDFYEQTNYQTNKTET